MSVVVLDVETTALPGSKDYPANYIDYSNRRDKIYFKGEVIQMTALVCSEEDLTIERFISFYCMPSEPISEGAFNVHKISNSAIVDLSGGKPLEEYLTVDYKDVFYNKSNIYVGHNISFDSRVINNNLKDFWVEPIDFGNPVKSLVNKSKSCTYCTMQNAKRLMRLNKNPKLTELVDRLGYNEFIPELNCTKIQFIVDGVCRNFNINNTGAFHNSDYDTICTWIALNHLIKL